MSRFESVLFISTSVPPEWDSHTIYNCRIVRSIAKICNRAIVVAPKPYAGDSGGRDDCFPENVQIYRVMHSPYDSIQHWLARWRVPYARWLLGVVGNAMLIPDLKAGWQRTAMSQADLLCRSFRPDVVISSSGSYTAHMIAAELVNRWGMPWIAILGDPWTLNPIRPANLWYRRLLNARIERRILPRASLVIVTTLETVKAYEEWLPSLMGRTLYLPVGYGEDELEPYIRHDCRQDAVLRLKYVGTAYRAYRSLEPVMRAIARVNQAYATVRVKLQVVGPHSLAFERLAMCLGSEAFEFTGHVPFSQSVKHMVQSEALCLLGNPGHLQIPGKVYLYLASSRPILYITQVTSGIDPTARLLRQFPGILYSHNTVDDITAAIERLLRHYTQLRDEAAKRIELPELKQYEWASLEKVLIRSLLRIYECKS